MRVLKTWCPIDALGERFGSWTIEIVEGMRAIERMIPVSRTFMVDRAAYDRDPNLMLGHVYGHLALHQGQNDGGSFTEAQEDEADDLADVMLDRQDDDYWSIQWRLLDAEESTTVNLREELPDQP